MINILAIDDDQNFLTSVKKLLELKSYRVDTLANPLNVNEKLTNNNYHLILCDVKMPGADGRDVLVQIIKDYPSIPVIMISGQGTIDIAVKSIKMGAYDFIEKPLDPDRLFIVIENAIKSSETKELSSNLYSELSEKYKIIGESYATKNLLSKIESVADTNAKILIHGESGTGKELVAWAIHHSSSRNNKPYVKVNCAAIPDELLESELFGHEKGAFTGADKSYKGKFIAANEGTLFLDEIGDLNQRLQAKLLRVLEDNQVEIIGSNKIYPIDVRIISATNMNLKDKIANNEFRLDLYHRLNVVTIEVPPLRKRAEDIPLLCDYFIQQFCSSYNKKISLINQNALGLLKAYNWPGNIRELKNIIEKLVIFNTSGEISIENVLDAFEGNNIELPEEVRSEYSNLIEAKENFEKEHIRKILVQNDWKIQETANELGIDRSNLFRKMQKYSLNKPII